MKKKTSEIIDLNILTEFEKKVYRVVSTIPIGQVRSYSWVANKIGKPKAARAVGAALGKNPFAPIIPCHRVVKNDGSLGGYSGGLAKKKQLLNWEKEIKEKVK